MKWGDDPLHRRVDTRRSSTRAVGRQNGSPDASVVAARTSRRIISPPPPTNGSRAMIRDKPSNPVPQAVVHTRRAPLISTHRLPTPTRALALGQRSVAQPTHFSNRMAPRLPPGASTLSARTERRHTSRHPRATINAGRCVHAKPAQRERSNPKRSATPGHCTCDSRVPCAASETPPMTRPACGGSRDGPREFRPKMGTHPRLGAAAAAPIFERKPRLHPKQTTIFWTPGPPCVL